MNKSIHRREPLDIFSPFFAFPRNLNEWLQGGHEGDRMIAPAMDVTETEEALTVTAELPGLRKEDVKITMERGVLTLSGEKRVEKEEKQKDFHLVERRYGAFHRSVNLPSGVDPNRATASFENGVLKITVPKAESAKPRQLEIK
jgi:HSP20 family protein